MKPSRNTIPYILLAVCFLLLAIIGRFIARDYGVVWDDNIEVARSTVALQIFTSEIDQDPKTTYETIGNQQVPYYGTAYTVILRFIETHIFPEKDHSLMVIAHYGSYFSFLLAIVGMFYLANIFFSSWISLSITLIFGTQPLFFGHAFLGPKDFPLTAAFIWTVALGFRMVDRWLIQDDHLSEGKMKGFSKSEWKFLTILLVIFLLLWSSPFWTDKFRSIIEFAWHNPSNITGTLFSSLITDLSLEEAKLSATLFALDVNRLLIVLALLGMLGLFISGHRKGLFSKKVDLILLMAAAAWGFAVSVRIFALAAGGIVGLYALMKLKKKAIIPLIFYTLTASIVSYASWPMLWLYGLKTYIKALVIFSDYPRTVPVLFEGHLINQNEIPWRFLPKLMALQFSEPLVILSVAGMLLGLYLLIRKKLDWHKYLLLYLWFFLPIIFTIAAESTLYNNFRQFFFITPPLFIFAALILEKIGEWLKKDAWVAVISLVLIIPSIFSVVHIHPYQYIYYNEFIGGIKGAEGNYPLDYSYISYKDAMNYANQHIPPFSSILVYKDNQRGSIYAQNNKYFNIKGHTGVPQDEWGNFDYAIIPSSRLNEFGDISTYPIIYSVEIDSANLIEIIKLPGETGNK